MSRSGPVLLLRADGGAAMGMGHLMRLLALAQAWQDAGGQAVAVAAGPPVSFIDRLRAEGIDLLPMSLPPGSLADADLTATIARERGAAWVATDGYHFDAAYLARLRAGVERLLSLDDFGHARRHSADLVLDQNLGVDEGWYAARPDPSRLLAGPRYALLRREFAAAAGAGPRPIPVKLRGVLVTLGGGAGAGLERVLAGLAGARQEGAEVVVVTGMTGAGAAFPAGFARRHDVGDMSVLMAAADLAVAAGGTTAWELACLGLPSLLLVLANNQRRVAAGMAAAFAAIDLGEIAALDPGRLAAEVASLGRSAAARAEMSERGRRLVDGEGAARVVQALRGDRLRLRPARAADARLLWRWANDPDTRAQSFHSEPIPWERHERWLEGRLSRPDEAPLIALDAEDRPVGQVRFDLRQATTSPEAVLSVSVAPEHRGKGLGSALIRTAALRLLWCGLAPRVIAYVKPENVASLQAFARAGLSRRGPAVIEGQEVVEWAMEA